MKTIGGWIGVVLAMSAVKCLAAGQGEVPSATGAEVIAPTSGARTVADLDRDWRFSKGDFASAAVPAFNDSNWRRVKLPHDWSIEGPFGPEYGSGNGYAPGGMGWYRKHFRLDPAAKGKSVAIEFDGVYDHSQVWINGHFVGGRPYGYSSFECDLTPHLKFGTEENVVAVRVDHSRFADSRWYTGSGIYRHVRLRITDKARIALWGIFVTTPEIREDSAVIQVETTIWNDAGVGADFSLESAIIAPEGPPVAQLSTRGHVDAGATQSLVHKIDLSRPQLWSPETPHLYALRSRFTSGTNALDEVTTPFGIRSLQFDPDKGFFLNGKPPGSKVSAFITTPACSVPLCR